MMLAHLLIKKSNCISVLLAVQGPLAQNVLEKAIAGVHLDALRPFDLVITIFWNNIQRTGYTGEDGFEIFIYFSRTDIWRSRMI